MKNFFILFLVIFSLELSCSSWNGTWKGCWNVAEAQNSYTNLTLPTNAKACVQDKLRASGKSLSQILSCYGAGVGKSAKTKDKCLAVAKRKSADEFSKIEKQQKKKKTVCLTKGDFKTIWAGAIQTGADLNRRLSAVYKKSSLKKKLQSQFKLYSSYASKSGDTWSGLIKKVNSSQLTGLLSKAPKIQTGTGISSLDGVKIASEASLVVLQFIMRTSSQLQLRSCKNTTPVALKASGIVTWLETLDYAESLGYSKLVELQVCESQKPASFVITAVLQKDDLANSKDQLFLLALDKNSPAFLLRNTSQGELEIFNQSGGVVKNSSGAAFQELPARKASCATYWSSVVCRAAELGVGNSDCSELLGLCLPLIDAPSSMLTCVGNLAGVCAPLLADAGTPSARCQNSNGLTCSRDSICSVSDSCQFGVCQSLSAVREGAECSQEYGDSNIPSCLEQGAKSQANCRQGYCKKSNESCVNGTACSGNAGAARCGKCGDSTQDAFPPLNEECDDGNGNDNDSCLSSCKRNVCGDNILDAAKEACDGDELNNQSCESLGLCVSTPLHPCPALKCNSQCGFDAAVCGICGDEAINGAEQCDAGSETGSCDADCTNQSCGDKYTNILAGETCDEGGLSVRCDSDCSAVICGDGRPNRLAGEQCDDGNFNNNDSCGTNCQLTGNGADTDKDGVPDDIEVVDGTNPNSSDSDGDGLLDGEEKQSRTDPKSNDSDGDGVEDDDELVGGTNPNNADSDQDGTVDSTDLFPKDPKQCGSGNVCGNPGGSWGEPHLVTFDGLVYDFHGAGEFVLARAKDLSLQVQTRTAAWKNLKNVTATTAAALNVLGDRVGVYLNRNPRLFVNGAPIFGAQLAFTLPQGGSVNLAQSVYEVRWPNGSIVRIREKKSYLDLQIFLPDSKQGVMEGLLGNFDKNAVNDLATKQGTILPLPPSFQNIYSLFGESWRILPSETLFDYLPGQSTETFVDRTVPDGFVSSLSLEPAARRKAEQVCKSAGLKDTIIFEACVLDVGLTGERTFAESSSNINLQTVDSGIQINDHFDLSAVNTSPANWTASGNSDCKIDSTLSFSAANSVRLVGEKDGCWESFMHRKIQSGSAPFTVETYVYPRAETEVGCHDHRAAIALQSGPSWATDNRYLIKFKATGQMSGSGGLPLGSYPARSWVKARVLYERPDSGNVRLTYWINDLYVGTELVTASDREDQLTYLTLSSGDGPAWFDDVRVIPSGMPFIATIERAN